MERDLDVIVYGATGFTGRLVAEHLARRGGDVRWGIAGRSAEKLERVAADLGLGDVPVVVADSRDPASVRAMADRTRVLCTTVGPYARHGMPVVEACVDAGTDYCDLTGEPQFIQRVIDRHQARAEATGARIVHTCGFDSIPSDLGVMVAQAAHHERFGRHAPRAQLRVTAMRGAASGGTVASLLNAVEEATADPAARKAMVDPYALHPAGERSGPQRTDAVNAGYDRITGQWIGPFVMATVNCKVVRRSNALAGYPYGRDFRYDEAIAVGTGPVGAAKAAALTGGMGIGMAAMAVPPIRGLAQRFLPEAGEGPDEQARARGHYTILVTAVDGPDRTTVRVRGDADPGYGSTSKMLGEAALCLAAGDEVTAAGGVHTPASALGRPLVERLRAHAGVTFDVV